MLRVLILPQDFLQGCAFEPRHLMLQFAESMRKPVQIRKRQLGLVDHRIGGIKDGILCEMPHAHASSDGHDPAIGRHFAHNNFEQRGLAASIGPDQADALAFIDGEINLVEEQSLPKVLFDVG